MSQEPGREEKAVQINVTVNVSGVVERLWKARSAAFFALHDDLVDLDGELDILYRGQI